MGGGGVNHIDFTTFECLAKDTVATQLVIFTKLFSWFLLSGSFEEDTSLPKGLESWNKEREEENSPAEKNAAV